MVISPFNWWNSIAWFILVLVISIQISASFECSNNSLFVKFMHADIASLCWNHCHIQPTQSIQKKKRLNILITLFESQFSFLWNQFGFTHCFEHFSYFERTFICIEIQNLSHSAPNWWLVASMMNSTCSYWRRKTKSCSFALAKKKTVECDQKLQAKLKPNLIFECSQPRSQTIEEYLAV